MTTTKTRRPHWSAMLCEETLEEIAERMQELLGGDTYFTEISCNSWAEDKDDFSSVDVKTSQWLDGLVRRTAEDDGTFRFGIWWSTPRTSWGVSTGAKTQSEARDSGPHHYVYFTFKPDEIVIDHYAPARYRLRWIFAVERHDREALG